MDESFRVRIDKVFGSLASSSASSAPVSSLWCLAEDEIDNNQRSGEKEISESEQENEVEDLSVDEEKGKCSELQKPSDYDDEEWEIKNSIGMDSTLDMEEEEDDNDKVALGEKVYSCMKDVNDYETEADEWVEFPASFNEREKDPRANLIAAKLRLKEDAEAVNKLNSLHVSEELQDNRSMSTEKEKPLVVSEDNLLGACKESHAGSADDTGLKPILKRKENQADDSKLQKRVRFSSDVKDSNLTEGDKDSVMETSSPDEHKVEADYPIGIPDYMRNPSKYTRYTFDSGEVDEESNRKAYMDFLNMIRRKDEPLVDPLVELPRSVAFVPKKKPMAESKVENIEKDCEGRRVAIAVDTIEECTISAMEEDEPETAPHVIKRPGRQYRARAKEDPEEC
ncbi:tumor suppressing sub-chromosomal transferable candidate 4 [Arabidopsis suecica]|uniref:U5 small nuclear ribonucleoprotein TSSC4 n=1 Tax=Arabidopsis suecica TaxID=45249 RepID=A0A8T1ZA58_ARASU|nr:tumor suppressing sub-chromosomal transferable candidate 4 [Arabidopsis suecica]